MRMMLRICVISLSIIFLVLGVKFNEACAQQWEYVTQHIRQLVFEQSRFSLPITFQLPCSDDPSTKERILEKWRKPTQPSFYPPSGPQNASLIDESFLHFLIENRFAKVDKFVMGRGTGYMSEYKILSYSDTIKPYIVKGDFENDNFHIILAVRTLKSIDYTNEYEATPAGFKIKFFALTFTYTLSDRFPNLPKITKQFRGEARAFLDPDDGKWELDKLSLEDQDSTEYMTLLRTQYEIFVKKQQERFIASGLSFRCSDNNALFSFQFEGGKAPYKYGKLTLNGKTYEEVFGSYIEVEKSDLFTTRNPLYRIDFHQLEKGGGGFTIFIRKNWPFGWPPDISFPLQVGITIFDSASPPKSAYIETMVHSDSATMLSATEKLVDHPGLRFAGEKDKLWIEKDGKELKTEDTPKIESSLQIPPQGQITPGGMAYMWYGWPTPLPKYWGGNHIGFFNFDIFLTIDVSPRTQSAYYYAHQFHFNQGSGGYIGVQTNGTIQNQKVGKIAIFSIWDALEAEPGPQALCEYFTGEGEGWSCRIKYNWVEGRTYCLRIWELCCAEKPEEDEWWGAWIIDTSTGQETFIGKIKVSSSWQWLDNRSVVWVEYYGQVNDCHSIPYAKVRFKQPTADNGSFIPQKLTPVIGTTCTNASITLLEKQGVIFETGDSASDIK